MRNVIYSLAPTEFMRVTVQVEGDKLFYVRVWNDDGDVVRSYRCGTRENAIITADAIAEDREPAGKFAVPLVCS